MGNFHQIHEIRVFREVLREFADLGARSTFSADLEFVELRRLAEKLELELFLDLELRRTLPNRA